MLTADEYRAVFEASPDGILIVGGEGVVRDVNPQVETLFGYAREELVGEKVEMLVPDVFRQAHEERRRRFVRNPHARPMGAGLELCGRRKDGAEFPVEISLSLWERDDGLFVICAVRDITARKRLQDFSEGAMRASEEERQRIARELHDDTAQRLATLMLRVRLLALESDPDAMGDRLEDLRAELLETAEGVKRIARGLRPPELEEVGLVTALRAHIRGLREATGFDIDASMEHVDHLLDSEAKLAIYRIVQEALSNVIRHAGTSEARLVVGQDTGSVVAEVRDEGRGFSEDRVGIRGGGLGLVGMHERAVMIGGRVTIGSTPGEGTSVQISVPVTAPETQNA